MTDDYDQFTKRMTSFDMVLDDKNTLAQSDDPADNFLSHYGVKGMKWGQRKAARIEKKAKEKYERSSEDAREAQAAKTKLKTSSVDSLSNKELQSLVQRMNLEQQLTGLQEKSQTKSVGRKFAEEIVREQVKNTVSGAIRDSVGAAGKKILADAINKKIQNATK